MAGWPAAAAGCRGHEGPRSTCAAHPACCHDHWAPPLCKDLACLLRVAAVQTHKDQVACLRAGCLLMRWFLACLLDCLLACAPGCLALLHTTFSKLLPVVSSWLVVLGQGPGNPGSLRRVGPCRRESSIVFEAGAVK